MSSQTLLLSPHYDGNAAAAYWGLSRCGLCPIWPKSASLCDAAIGSVSMYSDGESEWEPGAGLGRHRFRSVWYRWARYPDSFPGVMECDQEFLRREWRQYQSGVEALAENMSSTLWVNDPGSAQRAECKLLQLQEAARCGLKFPGTLISNDPEKIRAFVRAQGPTIYKTFRAHSWLNGDTGAVFDTPATLIDESMLMNEHALSLCPGIFQSYVDKVCDLRVTIIGERVFPVRIGSSSGSTFVDWRPATSGDDLLLAEPYTLRPDIESRIQALMRRLGLVYGAMDLVVDKSGEIYFLEVNQVGQFLFIEQWLPELPLLQAMCSMLADGRTNYDLSSCSGVCFGEYQRSDVYHQWVDSTEVTRREAGQGSIASSIESVA